MGVPRCQIGATGLPAAQTCVALRLPQDTGSQVRLVAARAAALAADLRRTQLTLVQGLDGGLWTGPARDAFHERLGSAAPAFSSTVRRYEDYASALFGYGQAIDVTGPELRLVQARLRNGLDAALIARPPLGFWAHPQLMGEQAPMVGPVIASEDPHRGLYLMARQFQDLYNEWAAAVDRCVQALLAASQADRHRDPHGFAAIGHNGHRVLAGVATAVAPLWQVVQHPTSGAAWSASLGVVSAALTFIGIGLLLVCPVIAGVVLAVATVVALAQLGLDGARKQHGDSDVSWGDLGLEVLGVVPVSALIRPARSAVAMTRALSRSLPAAGERMAYVTEMTEQMAFDTRAEIAGLFRPVIPDTPNNVRRFGPRERLPVQAYRSPNYAGSGALAGRWAPEVITGSATVVQWPERPDRQRSDRAKNPNLPSK